MHPETYRDYWEKGWAVEEGVFSREEADRIAQIALEVSQEELSNEGDGYFSTSRKAERLHRARSTRRF